METLNPYQWILKKSKTRDPGLWRVFRNNPERCIICTHLCFCALENGFKWLQSFEVKSQVESQPHQDILYSKLLYLTVTVLCKLPCKLGSALLHWTPSTCSYTFTFYKKPIISDACRNVECNNEREIKILIVKRVNW